MTFKPVQLSWFACAFLFACQSQAAPKSDAVVYTPVADCKEQIANDNAAFSELRCKPVGTYQLDIKQQSPQYFTILLSTKNSSSSSELETFTKEAPMEPGKTIEWHLKNGEPKFMVFRLKAEADGGVLKEYLTVNLVTAKRICPLASIETSKNPNANQKARDLIAEKFAATAECPSDIIKL